MSINLPFGGQVVVIPTTGDSGWGANVTLFLQLISLYSFQKIADFSNASLSLRQAIQTSTTNAGTGVPVLPNGSSGFADIEFYNKSNFTNSGVAFFGINPTATYIDSNITGSGTQLPIQFKIAGATQFTINPTGALGVGSSPSYGTSGQALTSAGSTAQPAWGNVVGSVTGTANQIAAVTTAGAVVLSFPANVIVPAPTSGLALTVDGIANSYAMKVVGSSTSGESLGLEVLAGTNASDIAFAVLNQAGSSTFFEVIGNGQTKAADDGGTLQIVGYRGVPQNTQSSSYTLQLSDRGKSVYLNGTSGTITVPASIYVAGDVVTLVASSGTYTISPGSGVTLTWATGTTGNVGTRTLAAIGLATIYAISATSFIISGPGIS